MGKRRNPRLVRWEERLLRELDDLEQQAEGLHLAEREATVAELSVSEYAEVELSSRLHASLGREVQLWLRGEVTVTGMLTRAGADWVLVTSGAVETLVPLAAILRVRGASGRTAPAEVRTVSARLGLGSALRQLAAGREAVAITLADGSTVRGTLRRVGSDFLEVAGEGGGVDLVVRDALVLVRRG